NPEVALDPRLRHDRRAKIDNDLYSFAACIFRACSGVEPPERLSHFEAILRARSRADILTRTFTNASLFVTASSRGQSFNLDAIMTELRTAVLSTYVVGKSVVSGSSGFSSILYENLGTLKEHVRHQLTHTTNSGSNVVRSGGRPEWSVFAYGAAPLVWLGSRHYCLDIDDG